MTHDQELEVSRLLGGAKVSSFVVVKATKTVDGKEVTARVQVDSDAIRNHVSPVDYYVRQLEAGFTAPAPKAKEAPKAKAEVVAKLG